MTTHALPDLRAIVKAVTELQHRAVMLNAMADAVDALYEDLPGRAPSRHANGLNAAISSVQDQSNSLANDLDKLGDDLRAAMKGGAA